MTTYRLIGYDIAAIHAAVVDKLIAWNDVEDCAIKHVPGISLSIVHIGPWTGEYDTMHVENNGFCAIHWSLPRGMALQAIVERHRVLERLADEQQAIRADDGAGAV